MSREDWRRAMGFLNPGRWFQVPYDLVSALGFREGCFLAELLHQTDIEMAAGAAKKGWIRMSTRRIRGKFIALSEQNIQRILDSLRSQGLIKTKTKGRRNKQRWIYTDPNRLNTVLSKMIATIKNDSDPTIKNDSFSKEGESPFQGDGENLAIARASHSETVRVKSIQYAPYREFAQKLHDMVQSVRKVNSTSKPSTWHLSFRALHKKYGIPIERISQALDWYRRVLKDRGDLMRAGVTYLPIAYTGPKWIEKWESIEIGMERDRTGEREDGPKLKVRMRVVEGSTKLDANDWGA